MLYRLMHKLSLHMIASQAFDHTDFTEQGMQALASMIDWLFTALLLLILCDYPSLCGNQRVRNLVKNFASQFYVSGPTKCPKLTRLPGFFLID